MLLIKITPVGGEGEGEGDRYKAAVNRRQFHKHRLINFISHYMDLLILSKLENKAILP